MVQASSKQRGKENMHVYEKNSIKEKMRCDGNVAVMEVECGIRL
jgi:hypothetical protein